MAAPTNHLVLDAATSGRGSPGRASPGTVVPGCPRSSGSAARPRPSAAVAGREGTIGGDLQAQVERCRSTLQGHDQQQILLHLGPHGSSIPAASHSILRAWTQPTFAASHASAPGRRQYTSALRLPAHVTDGPDVRRPGLRRPRPHALDAYRPVVAPDTTRPPIFLLSRPREDETTWSRRFCSLTPTRIHWSSRS